MRVEAKRHVCEHSRALVVGKGGECAPCLLEENSDLRLRSQRAEPRAIGQIVGDLVELAGACTEFGGGL